MCFFFFNKMIYFYIVVEVDMEEEIEVLDLSDNKDKVKKETLDKKKDNNKKEKKDKVKEKKKFKLWENRFFVS